MTIALSTLALAAGLGVTFGVWRRLAERGWLLAGWALMGLGLAGWAASSNADVGLSRGVAALMLLALIAVGAYSLTLAGRRKAATERLSADTLGLGPGAWARGTARLLGSLLAAPAAGMAAGLAWMAWAPGVEASRLIGMATVVCLATAIGLTVLLASARPSRIALALALIALALTAAVLLPGMSQ